MRRTLIILGVLCLVLGACVSPPEHEHARIRVVSEGVVVRAYCYGCGQELPIERPVKP